MTSHAPLSTRLTALHYLLAGGSAVRTAHDLDLTLQQIFTWTRVAGMELSRGRAGGLRARTELDDWPRTGHGKRLTGIDRARIQAGLEAGFPLRKIAVMIGAAPSTVSREVRRASLTYRNESQYDAQIADARAAYARARPKPRKLESNLKLRLRVTALLNDRFSPEQVAGRLRELFPTDPEMHVSHETIYQALYVQGKGALRHELTVEKALRSGRTGRIPQSKLPRRSNRPWLEGSRLTDRPVEAADRAVPGHWEGDLVVGPGNSGLVTLVERTTRFALLGRLPGKRDSTTVTEVLQHLIQDLPAALKQSLTWDQGSEMAEHARFTVNTGLPVFFCDPHSPWQRGSNENLNGLIRDFYPKGTNFNQVTDADIANMQRLLNIRPRKTLQFKTPGEKLEQYMRGVALTP